ncbi:MAG TPA: hypothetical protein VFS66_02340 [Acidimicrobiia bacterium]|nr:hypothetical protein [Acidimicrobiia bacterium]
MTETPATDPAQSFCEIAGCAGTAVKEVWSVDVNRHLRVCWKHTGEEVSTTADQSEGLIS